MNNKSFIKRDLSRPVLTCMLKRTTKEELFEEVKRGAEQGADAFGLSVGHMPHEFRDPDFLGKLFESMGDKPVYMTDYRRDALYKEQTDEERANELLQMVDVGATLIDIPGDFFCPSEGEIAMSYEAIEKQKALVDEIHKRGAEVLMSSHVLKYIPKEAVYSIALLHKKRGADISKIVTNADTEEELLENMEASLLLRRRLGLPYLFLCNGKACRKHRRIGTSLGSCIFLVTENSAPAQNQPRLCEALEILSRVENNGEEYLPFLK